MIEPDLAGFDEAQRRLRDRFGQTVVLLGPLSPQYPPGTVLDTDTGRAMDPVIEAAAQAAASRPETPIKANVATRIEGPEVSALGWIEKNEVALITDLENGPAIEAAEQFRWGAELYDLRAARPDGIGGQQRYVAAGARR